MQKWVHWLNHTQNDIKKNINRKKTPRWFIHRHLLVISEFFSISNCICFRYCLLFCHTKVHDRHNSSVVVYLLLDCAVKFASGSTFRQYERGDCAKTITEPISTRLLRLPRTSSIRYLEIMINRLRNIFADDPHYEIVGHCIRQLFKLITTTFAHFPRSIQSRKQ